jgi:hypothetical protein
MPRLQRYPSWKEIGGSSGDALRLMVKLALSPQSPPYARNCHRDPRIADLPPDGALLPRKRAWQGHPMAHEAA